MNWKRDHWLILGLVSIVAGFTLLGFFQSMTLSSILLVGGYCVLVPAYLWTRYRGDVGE
jgi:membrane protein implicated in regulation of membrane protease activity